MQCLGNGQERWVAARRGRARDRREPGHAPALGPRGEDPHEEGRRQPAESPSPRGGAARTAPEPAPDRCRPLAAQPLSRGGAVGGGGRRDGGGGARGGAVPRHGGDHQGLGGGAGTRARRDGGRGGQGNVGDDREDVGLTPRWTATTVLLALALGLALTAA